MLYCLFDHDKHIKGFIIEQMKYYVTTSSDGKHSNDFYATELVKTVWNCYPLMREQIKNQNFLAAHIVYLNIMSLATTLKYDAWSD